MSAPEVVVLDTRGAADKAAFLQAASRCLDFPAYQGANWDAFEESLREFIADRSPLLVIWTGASNLDPGDRDLALDIMDSAFTDGADLLIVDDVTMPAQPDYALDSIEVAVPEGGEHQARTFWVDTVGLREEAPLLFTSDALIVRVIPDRSFRASAAAGPTIMVRDMAALAERLEVDAGTGQVATTDPFGNRIRFVKY